MRKDAATNEAAGLSDLFGLDSGDHWLDRVREAETPAVLGAIGPYTLVEEVSRGGQGVVYRARREGASRDVALKRLLGGAFASPAAMRRFEREIETVASLDHPGIVSAHAIEILDGAPALAMEWVHGRPITRWAAEQPGPSGVDRIVGVFVEACEAVRHAHNRGVIHRDLKPGNLLVDSAGGPKVLDFGLARLARDWRESVTAADVWVGTLGYAAPEQLLRNQGDAPDIRADIYSLGVMLYECLTGSLPFPVAGGPLDWLQRAQAGAPSKLVRQGRPLPRELAAIVLTAMAHQPEHRYQSLAAMVDDLRQYLAGEPVQARPPTVWRTLRRAVRQHRTAVIASGVCLTVLVLSTSLAAASAVRAAGARREAVRALEREREAGEAAERTCAFILGLLQAADPDHGSSEATVRSVLEEGRRRLDADLQGHPEVANRVRSGLAGACLRRGMYAEAATEYGRVVEFARGRSAADNRPLIDALLGLSGALLQSGTPRAAQTHAEEAVALARALPGEVQRLAQALSQLAQALPSGRSVELLREAIGLVEAAQGTEAPALAEYFNNLGYAEVAQGRLVEGERHYARALMLERKATGGRTTTAETLLQNLCDVRHKLGDLQGAAAAIDEAVQIARVLHPEPHPALAGLLLNRARVQNMLNRNQEALVAAREALAVATGSLGRDHPTSIAAMITLGGVLAATDLQAEGEDLLRQGLATARVTLGPACEEGAVAGHRLALLLIQQDRYTEAAELLRQAAEDHGASAAPNRIVLAGLRRDLADVLLRMGRGPEAVREAERAVRVIACAEGAGPAFGAAALCTLADARAAIGDRASARVLYERVLEPVSSASAKTRARAQAGLGG